MGWGVVDDIGTVQWQCHVIQPSAHDDNQHDPPECIAKPDDGQTQGRKECTHHDFWVTVNRKGELYYPKVHEYVKQKERIMGTDVVIWHSTACHHEPRSEDGMFRKEEFIGATPVAWSGFDLRPRNLFNGTPHYPY